MNESGKNSNDKIAENEKIPPVPSEASAGMPAPKPLLPNQMPPSSPKTRGLDYSKPTRALDATGAEVELPPEEDHVSTRIDSKKRKGITQAIIIDGARPNSKRQVYHDHFYRAQDRVNIHDHISVKFVLVSDSFPELAGVVHLGRLIDFSLEGVQIVGPLPEGIGLEEIKAAEVFPTFVIIPDFCDKIELQGHLAWAKPDKDGAAYGFEFVDPDESITSKLRGFMIHLQSPSRKKRK